MADIDVAHVGAHWSGAGLRHRRVRRAYAGIRVNAVAPGLIATPLLERASGGRMLERAAVVPTRGLSTPEDIAHAVHWLNSPEARYATGTILSVDGGATAQGRDHAGFRRAAITPRAQHAALTFCRHGGDMACLTKRAIPNLKRQSCHSAVRERPSPACIVNQQRIAGAL